MNAGSPVLFRFKRNALEEITVVHTICLQHDTTVTQGNWYLNITIDSIWDGRLRWKYLLTETVIFHSKEEQTADWFHGKAQQ